MSHFLAKGSQQSNKCCKPLADGEIKTVSYVIMTHHYDIRRGFIRIALVLSRERVARAVGVNSTR